MDQFNNTIIALLLPIEPANNGHYWGAPIITVQFKKHSQLCQLLTGFIEGYILQSGILASENPQMFPFHRDQLKIISTKFCTSC